MQDARILELSDLQLGESLRELARVHPDSSLHESRDLLCIAGPDPFPVGFTNLGFPLGREPANPDAILPRCAAFFSDLGRGYTVWARGHLDEALEEACAAAGHLPLGDSPGMVLEAPSAGGALPDATFRFADDVPTAADFAQVAAGAYEGIGLPPAVTRRGFEHPERLLRPHLEAVVAYVDGRPAACALAILSHGIAGIYWVGTLPGGRQRGLGEAVTRLVGDRAFERGAACVVLQASRQGEPIYRRMGYREFTRYRWWVKPPPEGV